MAVPAKKSLMPVVLLLSQRCLSWDTSAFLQLFVVLAFLPRPWSCKLLS